MPDVQDFVKTAATTQPVSFQPQRITAFELPDGEGMDGVGMDVGAMGHVRTISPARIAMLVGMALLCWVPVAAALIALLD